MATVADAHADDSRAGIASRAVVLGALGVVFGDIGTSPLYALKEAAMAAGHGVLSPETVLGVLSLILWSLIVVISIKYCIFILRADNRGEGGIIALLALLGVRRIQPGSWRMYLAVMGLVGTALLYADGTITPAISVLSAVEGLTVDAPAVRALCRSDHARHSGGRCSRSSGWAPAGSAGSSARSCCSGSRCWACSGSAASWRRPAFWPRSIPTTRSAS